MLVEKEIEKAICQAVEALAMDGVEVRGSWQSAAAGEVKGMDETSRAIVAVSVSPRRFATFGLCNASVDVDIAVALRCDKCPTGAEIEDVLAPMAVLMSSWQLADADGLLDLVIPDAFYPGGVLMQGGEAPMYNDAARAWTVSQRLTITGTITHNGGR